MVQDLDRIRLSQQTKDQLSRLKRVTGMEQWNMICRWGFCISIADSNNPPNSKIPTDSNIEMEWETFAGEHSSVYWGFLLQRAKQEGIEPTKQNLLNLLRKHITRGIAHLTARREITDIGVLFQSTAFKRS
jgi:DNA sulfur modification protein DndE